MSNRKRKLDNPELRKSLETDIDDLDAQLEKINALLGTNDEINVLSIQPVENKKPDSKDINGKSPRSSNKGLSLKSLSPSPNKALNRSISRDSLLSPALSKSLSASSGLRSSSNLRSSEKKKSSKTRDTDFVMEEEPKALATPSTQVNTTESSVNSLSKVLFEKRPRMKTFPSLGFQSCAKILDDLIHHKNGWPFLQPVDPVALKIPDYFDKIRYPMDLGTIYDRFHTGYYTTLAEFAIDLRLVWSNAMIYNKPTNGIYVMAKALSELFEKSFSEALELDKPKPSISKKEIKRIANELNDTMEIIEAQLIDLRRNGLKWSDAPEQALYTDTNKPNILSRNEVNIIHFTDQQKIELHNHIQLLPQDYLLGIIQIIEDEMPHFLHKEVVKIQLDLAQLDDRTLSRIGDYTFKCLKKAKIKPEESRVTTEPSFSMNESRSLKSIANSSSHIHLNNEMNNENSISLKTLPTTYQSLNLLKKEKTENNNEIIAKEEENVQPIQKKQKLDSNNTISSNDNTDHSFQTPSPFLQQDSNQDEPISMHGPVKESFLQQDPSQEFELHLNLQGDVSEEELREEGDEICVETKLAERNEYIKNEEINNELDMDGGITR